MKKFENLKKWEVEAMRNMPEANCRLLLSYWGAKAYDEAKKEQQYFVGDFPKIGRFFIRRVDDVANKQPDFLRRVPNFNARNNWVVSDKRKTSKGFASLKDAYNFVRKMVKKGENNLLKW